MKTDLSQSCGHCWIFQICWHIEFSTFTGSSFRIWNSSTRILSPPLASFIVMLPPACFTSHSRMSGSRWVIIPLLLSGPWRSFLYSSVYSHHLFSISSVSVRSLPFLSFIVPIFAWNVPLVSLIFLKRLLVFPIPLFSSISLHWSLRKAFLSFLSSLWNSAFKSVYLSFSPLLFASLLSSAVCKASPDSYFAVLYFFFLGMVLISVSCTMSRTSVDSSSGTLSDLIPGIYLSLPLYSHKGFALGHTEWSSGFPYFLQFKSEFGNKEFMIWATVSSRSCFCWLHRASPFLAAKNIISLISVLTIRWCPCVESSLVLLEEGVYKQAFDKSHQSSVITLNIQGIVRTFLAW